MLTKLTIRNFKRFEEAEIGLGNPVVFVGPNNSGKTSAMQALTLWDIGLKRWGEKYAGKSAPEKRPGVTLNRRDLFAIPLPNANQLWRNLHTRDSYSDQGRTGTKNVRIDLTVEGIVNDSHWKCGLEFDYANAESLYCRPLRQGNGKHPNRMPVPKEALSAQVVFLPPMSGLAAVEPRLVEGTLNARIGEGRTAEVLRNLCFHVLEQSPENWNQLVDQIEYLFGAKLEEPRFVRERGEITMQYREHGVLLDLSQSGRGLQQTLLILAYMNANPGTVILLDEPDAHLDILRQRQIYNLISDTASSSGSQIVAASHSEVLLNEAGGKDTVIAFNRHPRRIDATARLAKILTEIGFDQYYQAEQTGWVLYLDGSTDLAILQALAMRLNNHAAVKAFEKPFVRYVGNQPSQARNHYYGLREALPDLKAVALFDRLDTQLSDDPYIEQLQWQQREIENYLCTERTLETYAQRSAQDSVPMPLFDQANASKRLKIMRQSIQEFSQAMQVINKQSLWGEDIKASDDFLIPLFENYFEKLKLPNVMRKGNLCELAHCIPADQIDAEVNEKLNAIAKVAQSANC